MSTNNIKALKHILLFIPGVFQAQIEGYDEEKFPFLSEKLLNPDMNQVKQWLEKNWTPQGFKDFLTAAKINFGIEPADKLTPEIWKNAVLSYKHAQAGKTLILTVDEGEVPATESYEAASSLRGTVFSFAELLSPEFFKSATEAAAEDRVDVFTSLMEVTPEEVKAAVETATEKAPEQQLPAPAITAAEEQASEEPAEDAAEEETFPAIINANGTAALAAIVQGWDKMENVLVETADNTNAAIGMLQETQKTNEATLRNAFREIRQSTVTALMGVEAVPELQEGE